MEPIRFDTEDGVRLEGEIRVPEGPIRATAVICHPHPKHGGSKDHPILWALRNELAGVRDITTLVFNFRGVMGSTGAFGGGRDETNDVRAAIDTVRATSPDVPTVVCGWSFGANVALREAIEDPRVEAMCLFGIPLEPGDVTLPALPTPDVLGAWGRPVMLLAGEVDTFCPTEQLRAFARGFNDARVEIVEGTDHFLGRHERAAAALAGGFVDEVLGA